MNRSRLNTMMVYFQGIFFTNDSTRNSELSSSLSAMGSRYSQHGLLIQNACQQPVESVAQSGDDQQAQRPTPVAIEDVDDDERNEDEPKQCELVRRGQNWLFTRLPAEGRVSFYRELVIWFSSMRCPEPLCRPGA